MRGARVGCTAATSCKARDRAIFLHSRNARREFQSFGITVYGIWERAARFRPLHSRFIPLPKSKF